MSRPRTSLAGITLAGVLAIMAAAPLAAQPATAEISGTVTDESGAALAEVVITLSGEDGESSRRITGRNGRYGFTDLPPGDYDLLFTHAGFAPVSRSLTARAGAGPEENAVLPKLKQSTVAMTVDFGGTTNVITNQASVSTSTPEGNPGDESAMEETTVTSQADLVVTTSDSVDPVVAGTSLTYTVTVANNGPSHARYVEVTDTLPAGVNIESTNGCAEDPAGLPICSLGTIAAGDSKRFTATVAVTSGATGAIIHQFNVGSQTKESAPGDESASEATQVDTRADLSITTSDSIDPVTAGHLLTYTVRVTNSGPSDARDVEVTDTLTGVSSDSTVGCQEDPGGIPTCGLGTIPAGTSKQYTVTVPVAASSTATVTNDVTVTSSTTEVSPGNESASESTAVDALAGLVITTTDSVNPVVAGTPLIYTVTVANNGPSDAIDIEVTSDLPSSLTSASTIGCAEDPGGAPTCSLGTLSAGSSKQFTVSVTVDPAATGRLVSRVSVASPTAAPSSAAETTQETSVDTRADLVLTNRDSVDPVVAGLPLTYTVTVANNGPSDARDVEIAGTLPAGVTFLSTAGCAEDSGPRGGIPKCTLGTIAAGTSRQYDIALTVNPDATGVITNRASATSTTTEGSPGDESVPPAPGQDVATSAAIVTMVRSWASAWSEQRFDDYLGFYAQGFRPSGPSSRAEWEARRRSQTLEPASIDLNLGVIETVILSPDRARASFDQDYRTDAYSDRVRKTLTLVREGGDWKILEESSDG